jgi:hypothetical protein
VIGAGEVGAALVAQPLDGLFFTGSYATGAKIAEAMRGRMVRLQLELGGRIPSTSARTSTSRRRRRGIADGAFYNTGQSCCSVERIYVHEKVFEPFVEAFVAEVKGYVRGDPEDEKTYIGPLTRAPQVDVLDAQVKDAVKKGARVLLGGKRVKGKGNWFEPTVLVNVDHSMDVMRAESFGPVIGIMAVKDDEEAVRAMKRHRIRPHRGGVFHQPHARREDPQQVNSGSVYWNCCDRVSPRLPWSGVGIRDRPHALNLRHRGLHATEGVAPARRVSSPFSLQGQTAFIPGDTAGSARRSRGGSRKRGASVAIAGRSLEKAEALSRKLLAAGHRAIGLALDARDVASIPAVVDDAAQELGGSRCSSTASA